MLWSRFGAYDVAMLERLLWRNRSLYESISFILPTADLPLHMLRSRAARRGERPYHARMNAWVRRNARLRRHVVARLRSEGALPLAAFEDRSVHSWSSTGWNDDRNVSQMLAFLMRLGEVTIGGRANGRRFFTLSSSWLPRVRPLASAGAARLATDRALRAIGIATYPQLRRYYALGFFVTADALKYLERSGVARRVAVDGVPGDHFVHATAGTGEGERTTLLSPFDSLIIDRARTEALFGMRYRMEIYVPKHLRARGYWAMPILHRDELIGTVDPRMDRAHERLEVLSLRLEPGAPRDHATRRAIEDAVTDLATFAGATDVSWPPRLSSAYSRR